MSARDLLVLVWFICLVCSAARAEFEMKRYSSHCSVVKNGAEACVELSAISIAPLGNDGSGPCRKNTKVGPCDRQDFVCGYAVGVPPQPGDEDGSMRFRFFSSDAKYSAEIKKECDRNVASGKLTGMVRRIDPPKKAE